MSGPISVNKNNYHKNNSIVYTPDILCKKLVDIYESSRTDTDKDKKIIFDPCTGTGNLLRYFKIYFDQYNNEYFRNHYLTFGMDIDDNKDRKYCDKFIKQNFLSWEPTNKIKPDLVIMNPPFNRELDNETIKWMKEHKLGKALLPDLFLKQAFDLFGHDQKVIMITPMGFRLNQRMISKRYKEYSIGKYGDSKITSIMSIPLDIFPEVQIHIEILFWNIKGIEPHYWLDSV